MEDIFPLFVSQYDLININLTTEKYILFLFCVYLHVFDSNEMNQIYLLLIFN